jgi:hypothetical protein
MKIHRNAAAAGPASKFAEAPYGLRINLWARRFGRASAKVPGGVWPLLFILAIPALWPFLVRGLPQSYDGVTHLLRLALLDNFIHQGIWFPRWMPDLILGSGAPILNFYAPLTYYLAEGLHLAGLTNTTAFMASMALFVILAGGGMFLLARDVYGLNSPWPAIVAAIAYMYAPYLQHNIFIRGAIAEAGAQAILPWVLWSLRRLIKDPAPERYVLPVIFSLGALILAHNITLLLAPPILAIYMLVLWQQGHWEARRLWWLALALLGAAGATCYFWAPMILERNFLTTGIYTVSARDFMPGNFWRWNNFLNLSLKYVYSFDLPVRIGLVQLLLAAAGAVMARRRDSEWLSLIIMALVTGLSIGAWTSPVWLSSPILLVVQFPWRLLSLLSVLLALLTGGIIIPIRQRTARLILTLALLGLVIVTNNPRVAWMDPLPAGFDNLTAARIAQYEKNTGAPGGANYTGELSPRWAGPLAAAPRGDEQSKDLNITLQRGNSLGWQAAITSSFGSTLRLTNSYFPGWQAILDGATILRTYPMAGSGLLAVDLPPGRHELTVKWTGTGLERVAGLISVLILGGLAVLGWWRLRPRWLCVLPLLLFTAGLALIIIPAPMPEIVRPSQPVQVSGMRLVGYRAERTPVGSLSVRPYWLLVTRQADLQMRWQLRDDHNQVVSELIQAPYFDTGRTSQWPAGTLVNDGVEMGLPSDLQSSQYTLYVQTKAGDGSSENLVVGRVDIPAFKPAMQQAEPTFKKPAHFGTKIELAGFDLSLNNRRMMADEVARHALVVHPGDVLRYTLYWQAVEPLAENYRAKVELVDTTGIGIGGDEHMAGYPSNEPTSWDPYRLREDSYRIIVPPDVRPGVYSLQARVYAPASREQLAVRVASSEAEANHVVLHEVKVIGDQARVPQHAPGGQIASVATFEGYDLTGNVDVLAPGSVFTVTLYYRAAGPTATSYTRFVQLVDSRLGMAAQNDGSPQDGQNPTQAWVAGELIVDPVRLTVAPDAHSGMYTLTMGFYDLQDNLKRLPLRDSHDRPVPDNQFNLTNLQIR